MKSAWSVSKCRPNPSAVVVSCELCQTADATQLDSCVQCVASVSAVCVGLEPPISLLRLLYLRNCKWRTVNVWTRKGSQSLWMLLFDCMFLFLCFLLSDLRNLKASIVLRLRIGICECITRRPTVSDFKLIPN